jgi:hypothetical protein
VSSSEEGGSGSDESESAAESEEGSGGGSGGGGARRRGRAAAPRLLLPVIARLPDQLVLGGRGGGGGGGGSDGSRRGDLGPGWWAALPRKLAPLSRGPGVIGHGGRGSAWRPWPGAAVRPRRPPRVARGADGAGILTGLPDCAREVLAAAQALGVSDAAVLRAAERLSTLLRPAGGG